MTIRSRLARARRSLTDRSGKRCPSRTRQPLSIPGKRNLCLEPLEDRRLLAVGFGGEAWQDLNTNGIQDANESGLPGIVVEAFSSTDSPSDGIDAVSRGAVLTDSGAQSPLTVDPFIQEAILTASDGADGGIFGASIAISGNTIVVGAPYATVKGHDSAGAAYVFKRPDAKGNFVEVAKLTASDARQYDNFGYSVAISGNTVVIGSPVADIFGAVPLSAAYVFVEPDGGWSGAMTETAKLTASDEVSGDQFGYAVAIAGDTIAVTARYAPAEANSCPGAVYVFQKQGGGWSSTTETSKLYAANVMAGEYLGASVAISGNTIVTGWTLGNNAAGATAYLFVKPDSVWPAKLTETAVPDTHASLRSYGAAGCCSVAISDKTVVVGVPMATNQTEYGSGAAFVFVEPASGWTNLGPAAVLYPSDGVSTDDGFGDCVAVDGGAIVVTADRYYMPAGVGAVYTFFEPATGWNGTYSRSAAMFDPGRSPWDSFGCSAAIWGDTIAVGSYCGKYQVGWRKGAVYLEDIPGDQVKLNLAGSVSATSVIAGSGPSNLTYTFTISNPGPSDATGVALANSIAFEPGVSVVSVVGSDGTIFEGDGGNGTWLVGNLADGASATLTITLTVGASAVAGTDIYGDCLHIVAVDQSLADSSRDTANVAMNVLRNVDLAVALLDSPPSVVAGTGPGNVTYVFTVTNHGPSDASGVSLTNSRLLENGVSVDSVIASTGTSFHVAGRTETWTVDKLAVGATATLTISLTVAGWASAGDGVIGDFLQVTGVDQPRINTDDDRAQVTTTVVVAIDPNAPMSVLATTPSLNGGTLRTDASQITVYFSKLALGANDATNYWLYGLGPDGLLGTADDVTVSVATFAYDRTAILSFSPLPEGVYRLVLRRTITDTEGHPLDGNGAAGEDWEADFVVTPTALFPSFNTYSFEGNSFEGPHVAAGDFNGDGFPDLAVADGDWHGHTLLNDGHGGFQPEAALPGVGAGVVTADFNRDAKLDLLFGGRVLLGDGRGGFAQAGSAFAYDPAYNFAVGDFNSDGIPDVAVPIDTYYGQVGIAYGDGNGDFASATLVNVGDSNPQAIAVGDFNGDGSSQFAVACSYFEGSVRVSSFGMSSVTTGVYEPAALAAGDFNGDGKADLVVLDSSNVVSVLLSIGNGQFGPPTLYGGGGYRSDSIVTGDFNGDENLDIACTVGGRGAVAVLSGDGKGGFSPPV